MGKVGLNIVNRMDRLEGKEDFSILMKNLARVISSLDNEDALKIFYEAKDGIVSSSETIRKLGLTQKRYYVRLNELMKAGLIQKRDNKYQHTTLGKICYRLGEVLLEAVKHNEQLELIDKVRLSSSLSKKEKEEVIYAVSRSILANFAGLLEGGIKPVGIVTRFEDIVAGMKMLIEKAEKEVYIATRYTDPSVTEAILNSLNRGIKMYLLDGDKKNLSDKFQLIRLLLSHPRMIRLFYDVFRSPNVCTWFTANLPYSFVIVDEKYVGIEIPKPGSDEFFVALFFENELLARKLKEVFNLLVMNAKEDPKKEFSEKIYAQLSKKRIYQASM